MINSNKKNLSQRFEVIKLITNSTTFDLIVETSFNFERNNLMFR